MKPGANKLDQIQIYRLMNQGFSAHQISRQIGVYLDTVKNFMTAFEEGKYKLPTSAFAEIKEGMPKHPSQAAGFQQELKSRDGIIEQQSALIERLSARLDALEAKDAPSGESKVAAKTSTVTAKLPTAK